MRRDGAAKITGQQNRAEHRSTRNYIEDRTGKQDDPKRHDSRRGISELNGCLHDRRQLYEFHDAVHEQKQYRQRADDAAGPERSF